MARAVDKKSAPVERDFERFRLLFANSRPVIPAGYNAPASCYLTTREERSATKNASASCAGKPAGE